MAHSAGRVRVSVVAGGVMLLALSRGAEAQDARPPAAVETWAGYATVEDGGNHALAGAGLRFYTSPRLSLSPRVRIARTFGDTPDDHTDLYLETRSRSSFDDPLTGARAWSRRSCSSAAAFGSNASRRLAFPGNGRASSQPGA